jgi:phosphatidylglycerol:prolipoprotein diacylglycerol transferase
MSPILFKLGPLVIYSYGLFYGLGIVVAMALTEYRARPRGIESERVLNLGLLMTAAILVGARTFYVIQFSHKVHGWDVVKIWKGGQVLYGGLILSVPVGIAYAKHFELDLAKLADVLAPAIPLGVGIGRIGCFLEGCCYGTHAEHVPWAVAFPKLYSAKHGIIGAPAFVNHLEHGLVESSMTQSLPVHLTQLYASVVNWTIAGIILLLGRYKLFRGRLIWVFLMLYAFGRFNLEFFRGDNESVLLGMTISQVVGVLVLAAGATAFHLSLKRGSELLSTRETPSGRP